MPKADLYTLSGTKSGQMELPKEIFAAKINEPLMVQAVRVYLSNQRKAQAKVKSRGEVARTTAKWFQQKGTGRARHGARSAPIFVGGGVAHGPTGEQNYQLKLPKKMKKQALFSALSSKFKTNEVMVIKDLEKIEPKTKKMKTILEKLAKDGKATIILSKKLENVSRAARNLKGVNLSQANQLNPYEVLNGGKLIFMKEAVEKLKEKWI
ncbi:50S ribosomal protein L4 [Patescibacteria group bacterium]|nr:50S ribosomal protein L4 [Patescibacteria group bacterium]